MCTLSLAPVGRKVRSGVSFDPSIVGEVDRQTDALKAAGVTRSEVVNAILAQYFQEGGSTEKVREAVIRGRKRNRE